MQLRLWAHSSLLSVQNSSVTMYAPAHPCFLFCKSSETMLACLQLCCSSSNINSFHYQCMLSTLTQYGCDWLRLSSMKMLQVTLLLCNEKFSNWRYQNANCQCSFWTENGLIPLVFFPSTFAQFISCKPCNRKRWADCVAEASQQWLDMKRNLVLQIQGWAQTLHLRRYYISYLPMIFNWSWVLRFFIYSI